MFHIEDEKVKSLLMKGNFGLERESLRVTKDGYLAQTPHPFPDDPNIVRDFCENQIEINTGVSESAEGALEELAFYDKRVKEKLNGLEEPEYLWAFSNPPYIKEENDIPVAVFTGDLQSKTVYRHHLSRMYGRYKMTLSGIHVNYSFADDLLMADFELSGKKDFEEYKDGVYLELARNYVLSGWIVNLLLAASPLSDSSYNVNRPTGSDLFLGMASLRCSEMGYWNHFTPVLSYDSVKAYADSIEDYIIRGYIKSQTELYYPVRLKPRGENKLETLKEKGVDHIEIRNVDLNPYCDAGLEYKDLKFLQLLLVYLSSVPGQELTEDMQIKAAQNFKNAAHYDIDSTNLYLPGVDAIKVREAGMKLLRDMKAFYENGIDGEAEEILLFQENKLTDNAERYAVKVLKEFSGDFVKKGLMLSKQRQGL